MEIGKVGVRQIPGQIIAEPKPERVCSTMRRQADKGFRREAGDVQGCSVTPMIFRRSRHAIHVSEQA